MFTVWPKFIRQPSVAARIGKVVVALLALGLFSVGTVAGRYLVDKAGRDAIDERKTLLSQIDRFAEENDRLKKQKAILQSSSDIDRMAVQHAQNALEELQEKLSETRRELAFYRRVVSPVTKSENVLVQDFRILHASEYQYWLALARGFGRKGIAKGDFRLIVNGTLNGKNQSIDLAEIGAIQNKKLSFKFRHFQLLKGSFSFPENFVPDSVEITILPHSKKPGLIEKKWSWVELTKKTAL